MLELTEFLGDGIGPELRESLHAVASALPLDVQFRPGDLSGESPNAILRRRLEFSVIHRPVISIRAFTEAVIADLDEKLSNSSP